MPGSQPFATANELHALGARLRSLEAILTLSQGLVPSPSSSNPAKDATSSSATLDESAVMDETVWPFETAAFGGGHSVTRRSTETPRPRFDLNEAYTTIFVDNFPRGGAPLLSLVSGDPTEVSWRAAMENALGRLPPANVADALIDEVSSGTAFPFFSMPALIL